MAGNAHRCPVGGALSPSVTRPSSRCPVAPFATWWRSYYASIQAAASLAKTLHSELGRRRNLAPRILHTHWNAEGQGEKELQEKRKLVSIDEFTLILRSNDIGP